MPFLGHFSWLFKLSESILPVGEDWEASVCERALKWSRFKRWDAGTTAAFVPLLQGEGEGTVVPLWDPTGDFPSLPRFLPFVGFVI